MSSTLFVQRESRIELIDVLRGFTLLGIIIVHMVEQYYAGVMPESVRTASPPNIVDSIVEGFAGIFIMGKFFMIFSFLFGLSFFIQSSKADNNKTFFVRFTWRLIILFIIGLLHHVHYRGDILTIYAVLGLGLLLCFKLPDKLLLVIALALIVNVPSVVIRLTEGLITGQESPFPDPNQDQLMHYYTTAKTGTYFHTLELNFYALKDKMEFQILSGRIFITFGLFLLGLYAGRKKFFEQLEENIPIVKKLLGYSWKILAFAILVALIFFGGAALLKLGVPQFINFSIGGFLYDIFNACISLLYVTTIILLFQKQQWKNRLMHFYEVGRMGLTTYLMQSLFGVLIFFNMGLGLLSELGAAWCFVLAIVLFVGQIVLSKIWFRYFYYGFFEWAWRTMTYFKIAPLFRKNTDVSVNSIPTAS